MGNHLGILLQLCDPTLPIGGYSHSNGLETYVQQDIVKDVESTRLFIQNMIHYNWVYNDVFFVRLAYEAFATKDFESIVCLDLECGAFKIAKEIRQAGRKLGIRTIKIFNRQINSDLISAYEKAIYEKKAEGQYPIVFGMYACLFDIPIEEALQAFIYTTVSATITNAVKLVPLGQLSGQDILYGLQDDIAVAVTKVLGLDRSQLGLCNAALDIRCMQHEKLYSRLYMS